MRSPPLSLFLFMSCLHSLLVVSTGLDIPKPWSIQSPDDTVELRTRSADGTSSQGRCFNLSWQLSAALHQWEEQ